ncbi:MAG: hypothetical protein R3B83_02810 [Nitrospirales bacterium]|nr:hypothetical protein [Nitrospirales bacterium]
MLMEIALRLKVGPKKLRVVLREHPHYEATTELRAGLERSVSIRQSVVS